MASRGELIELFGKQGTTSPPDSLRDELDDRAELLDPLFTVGLPLHVKGVYAVQPDGTPETFSLFPVSAGTEIIQLVTLGAPNRTSSLRYFLDTKNGYVVLTDLESDQPQLEVINESLNNFIEFLYRIARFRSFKQSVGDNDRATADYKELLSSYLMSSDSFSMERETNWWSMVFTRAL